MRSRTFYWLTAGLIALGVSYGGVFGAGVMLGKSDAPESAESAGVIDLPVAAAAPTGATPGQAPVVGFTADDVTALRQQLQQQFGGQLPSQLEAALDRFRDGGTVDLSRLGGGLAAPVPGGQLADGAQLPQVGRLGPGGARGGQGGQSGFMAIAGGVAGKIAAVSDSQITLDTAQGSVPVALGADTAVQNLSASTVASLKQGDEVTVRGQRQQDGTIRAVTITRQAAP